VLGVPPAAASAVTPPALRVDGATAGEQAGTSLAAAGDVDGDGHEDLVVGAPLASPGGRARAGMAYLLLGPLAPGELDLAAAERSIRILGPAPGALAGMSVAAAGDVNGDGLDDVVVGAPGAAPNEEGPAGPPGHAYVVFGARGLSAVDLAALGPRGFAIAGERRPFPDAFGFSVAGAGDVDGDGRADVAVGAPGNQGFESETSPGRASSSGAGPPRRCAPGGWAAVACASSADRRAECARSPGRATWTATAAPT